VRLNFRLGWFRVEILPKFKIMFDVRRTVAGKVTQKPKRNIGVKSTIGVKSRQRTRR
jgi:hypothetical protein